MNARLSVVGGGGAVNELLRSWLGGHGYDVLADEDDVPLAVVIEEAAPRHQCGALAGPVGTVAEHARVVAVIATGADRDRVSALIDAGASAVVTLDDDIAELARAIECTLEGGGYASRRVVASLEEDETRARSLPALSDGERRMAALLVAGSPIKEAAAALGVKPATGRVYVKRIRAKYAATGEDVSTPIALARRLQLDEQGAA